LNIKAKLILILLLVSLSPLAVLGWSTLNEAQKAIEEEVFDHLISVRNDKVAQIQWLFERNRADIKVLASSSHITDALDAFSSVVQNGEVIQEQFDYFESLAYGDSFRQFINEYDYYDLMLVNEGGDIVYSTKREKDFGRNVLDGPLKDSQLGRFFTQGLEKVVTTDFQLYAPSGGKVLSFLIAPIGEPGSAAGAVVLKMSNGVINKIMLERSGMGETGGSYLVGQDNLMRSDSYLDNKNRSVIASFANPKTGSVDTQATRAALAGESGRAIILDYRNELVLSAYLPIKMGDTTYALMAEIDEKEAFLPIEELQYLMAVLATLIIVAMIAAAYYLANLISRPILELTTSSILIAQGDLETEVKIRSSDELGVLSENFNSMRISIQKKIEEINQNQKALKEANETLEDRVEERTRTLAQRNHLISQSIKYASRIQRSVLPSETFLKSAFSDHFVIWKPRHVVGGDMYWCHKWGEGTLVILGDCTGHGVPGAFMTLISTGALDHALSETQTGDVGLLVQKMHQHIQQTLGQDSEDAESDDGLELGACYISQDEKQLTFVGARFDLFAVENGAVTRYKGDKKGIGYGEVSRDFKFKEISLNMRPSQSFYMTTDGLIDQIGEETNRSFGKRRFEDLLVEIQDTPISEQKGIIIDILNGFQGTAPRLDDIAVLGFNIGQAENHENH
jgi:serine phosphatase RsbU (regulator of sigma subunit)